MPPGKYKRCTYIERGDRCRRKGTGSPALCEAHRIVIEQEAARPRRPGEHIVGVVMGALFGSRPSDDELMEAAEEAAALLGLRYHEDARRRAAAAFKAATMRARERAQGARGRAPPPPPREKPPQGVDPRSILGFAPRETLTPEIVKKRYRELARKYHPDRPGGSTARMIEINAAVDQLLATM
jgi:hypothetical protein